MEKERADNTIQKALRIHPADDVAVALGEIPEGVELLMEGKSIVTAEKIPAGHKFALCHIAKSEHVRKYGYPIGHASREIEPGEWVHTHNLVTNLSGELAYRYEPEQAPVFTPLSGTFQGILRKDGAIGIRNWIWILPTVGCVNKVAKALAEAARPLVRGSVDGVVSFEHPYGCSQMTEDQDNTRRILADFVHHPNAGGILVLGLGCENTHIDIMKEFIGDWDSKRVRFLNCQDVEDEHEEGLRILSEIISEAASDVRVPVGLDKLVIGLKCGGSDGFSGITANPVIGGFSDLMIRHGGATILTEVPEMFGAETILMNRCGDEALFRSTVEMINGFKRYFIEHGQTVYENPSYGNKVGGISTLEDKSLGCTQKAGTASVSGVLGYGERISGKGLNLLYSPGNDLVSATALAASGAHMVLFSTGRGTPFACPVPTLKIATNDVLASKKNRWIDFDASSVLTGRSYAEAAQDLFEMVVQVASGKLLRSEEMGFHDMAIFHNGVTV